MARFYANENFPLPVVEDLRRLGHDVLTVHETGNANREIPDDEVLAFARAESRCVLTINRRDFIKLHNLEPNHSGIIVCTFDPDFTRQATRFIRQSNPSAHWLLNLSESTALPHKQ